MHFESEYKAPDAELGPDSGPWYKDLTRYHWFVLVVAALGWLFDTMDQQLFNLARRPAITELIHRMPGPDASVAGRKLDADTLAKDIDKYGGYSTSIFMIGWALGGLFFGVLGDKIGRAKTMMLTI